MDIVLWVFGGVVLLIVLFAVIGTVIGGTLPQDHVAARTVRFRRSPEVIWVAINDPRSWRRAASGWARASSSSPCRPPRLLVRKVVGERDYGGTWTRAIAPTAEGCTLTITENGYVYNRFFRFMSRYVIGHHRSIDGVMNRLRAP
jgi:hypothetical protein